MSENCSGSCSSCSSDCESRKGPQIVRNANNGKVKKVIAVVSGKGGVGKSLVTSMLAVKANKEGKKAAILDADITGPSIPKSFGLTERVTCNEDGTVMYPETSKKGIKVMSLNLLMEKETDPVIWRGPVLLVLLSSSGKMLTGMRQTVCLLTAHREQVMYLLQFSSLCQQMESLQ